MIGTLGCAVVVVLQTQIDGARQGNAVEGQAVILGTGSHLGFLGFRCTFHLLVCGSDLSGGVIGLGLRLSGGGLRLGNLGLRRGLSLLLAVHIGLQLGNLLTQQSDVFTLGSGGCDGGAVACVMCMVANAAVTVMVLDEAMLGMGLGMGVGGRAGHRHGNSPDGHSRQQSAGEFHLGTPCRVRFLCKPPSMN